MISKLCKDPFRVFFPFAIFCLLYGSVLWISFGLFDYGEFPIQQHANLFVGGFLYFSILGFLLTAIPRFTSSDFLSTKELSLFIVILIGVLSFYFLQIDHLFWFCILSGWILLIIFGKKRFLGRSQNPPFSFVFVGLGVLFGLIGSFFKFLSLIQYEKFGVLEDWGMLLFYDGMVTAFILGVGGRLIPGILGFEDVVKEQREIYEKDKPYFRLIPFDISLSLLIFTISLVLEGLSLTLYGFLARALVICFFGIKYWQVHKKVKSEKWHGKMLRLSCLLLMFTSCLLPFFIDEAIHIKHIIYLGTYCLMTLLVASRVIIAHGSESLDLEFRKYPFLILGVLFTLAAFTRASAHLLPDSYINHLGYAGIVLFLGVLVWLISFLNRIIRCI